VNPIIGLFFVAALELGLAAAVLLRNPRRPVNRWFAAYATTLATWGALVGLRRVVSPDLILPVMRVLFSTAALIPVTFCQLAVVFPRLGSARPRALQAITTAGLLISGVAFSPWIVTGIEHVVGKEPQPQYGLLHKGFAIYFLLSFGWGVAHLAVKLRHARGFGRAQLQYLLFGAGITTAGALITNLVVPLVFGTSHLGVYGPYFTLFWLGFAAHSIVRHRLMDLRVVISRTAAYALGWALTAGLLVGGAVFLDTRYVAGDPTLKPPGAVFLGLCASVLFLAVAPRLRRLADRYLYRPAYDPAQLVREGSRTMGTFGDPVRVVTAMGELIDSALHLESLVILVQSRDGADLLPAFQHHVDPAFTWPERLPAASALGRELSWATGAVVRDDLVGRAGLEGPDPAGAELRAWNAEIAIPVRDGQLVALILGGPKLSGDSYFGDDLSLMETLASELAIGLKNAQLYHEIVLIKEYNERVLAHMDSGVVAVGGEGVVTTFNPAAERMTGLPVDRVLGEPMARLDRALQAVLQDGLSGQREAETEITVSHAEGRILPLVVHTSALHDHEGRVSGAIAVLNDHTRLRAREEDKRRVDRLAAMGAMATGIAHEIRNPLVAIKTFAELLPERASDEEFHSTFAKVAVKEIHRIEKLLGRLRALAGPTTVPLRPLDLQVPLSETLDLLRGEADRRRARLVVEIEPGLPPILGEPDQLKQLFLNLALNALEAMVSGGTLSVSVRADRERPDRGLVTVRVTDTGPGIAREELTRVFEPFFTTKSSGTGLGLAICRSIADAHRAALWAEPGPAGVGTAFVVQFPAVLDAVLSEVIR
jgi:PAS domain S-box-containing protein